jgi:hypothetical protein
VKRGQDYQDKFDLVQQAATAEWQHMPLLQHCSLNHIAGAVFLCMLLQFAQVMSTITRTAAAL